MRRPSSSLARSLDEEGEEIFLIIGQHAALAAQAGTVTLRLIGTRSFIVGKVFIGAR
jgi:hypothetical protein